MFNIRIADTVVGIDNKYQYVRDMCSSYLTDELSVFTVSANDEEIMEEGIENVSLPPDYLEPIAIYRKIADTIHMFDTFLMHGVLMETEGRGVLLCAESGTGKSTHAALWKSLLGEQCSIINGDKPLIRICDGIPYGYGTPWCGKEGMNENRKVRLSDICFLRRSEENFTARMPKEEVVTKLISGIHLPKNDGVARVLELTDLTAKNVSFWDIACNMDISAAEVAYNAIIK